MLSSFIVAVRSIAACANRPSSIRASRTKFSGVYVTMQSPKVCLFLPDTACYLPDLVGSGRIN